MCSHVVHSAFVLLFACRPGCDIAHNVLHDDLKVEFAKTGCAVLGATIFASVQNYLLFVLHCMCI